MQSVQSCKNVTLKSYTLCQTNLPVYFANLKERQMTGGLFYANRSTQRSKEPGISGGDHPAGVQALVDAGHEVVIQESAGVGSGFTDEEYIQAGASIGSVDDAWGANLVLKVKEPISEEYHHFREDLLLFTYLHLAADRPLTEADG